MIGVLTLGIGLNGTVFTMLKGRVLTPLARVGVYVPGGRASYPSTVVMAVVPARVAGGRESAVATPPGS